MRLKRQTTHTLALLVTAGVVSLAFAASATAVIYLYSNGFGSRADVKEMKKSGGGKKCDKRFRKKGESMHVSVEGRRLCEFKPPVVGDGSQPNQVIVARGKVLPKQTPKSLRDAAYLAVRVRVGGGDWYELQIRPKARRFKLERSPQEGAVSEEGRSDAIRPIKQANALRLDVKGDRVTAFVNGDELASVVDPNPGEVGGRKVSFGLGSRKDGRRATVGVLDRVRVGIPE